MSSLYELCNNLYGTTIKNIDINILKKTIEIELFLNSRDKKIFL